MTGEVLPHIPVIRMAATYPTGGPGGAQLSFETYLAQDVEVRCLHIMADKIEAVAQRQLYKGLIISKQDQIDNAKRQLEMLYKDLEKYEKDRVDAQTLHEESGRRKQNMGPLLDKKNEQIEICRANIEVHQMNIKRLQEDIMSLQSAIDNAVKE